MKRTGLRRIIAVAVAVMCMLSTVPTVFAASNQRADGISDLYQLEDMFSLGQSDDYSNLQVYAGDEIRIPLTADMFTWSDGRTPLPKEAVSTQQLINSKVRVGTKIQAGNITLDYVQLDTDVFPGKPFYYPGSTTKTGRTAYISVMLAEEFVSVEDKDFSVDIWLRIDNKSDKTMTITLDGTMLVRTQEVYNDEESMDTSDGIVVEAMESVRDFKMEIGQGITITKNLTNGKKYYATAQVKHPYDAGFEDDFPDIYPALEFVYKLNTVNMRSGNSKVNLNISVDEPYFVYGEDMSYLGRSNEELPFSEYYFMSLMELPTLEGLVYEEGLDSIPNWDRKENSSDEEGENPVTGGDRGWIENENFNPGTGR